MNFPDVPFDENLFSSNQMLKSYWERSTEKRLEATIPDYLSEEVSNELKINSLKLWDEENTLGKPQKNILAAEPHKEEEILIMEPEKKSDAKVYTKSNGTFLVIFIYTLLAAFVIYWAMQHYYFEKRY